MNGSDAIVVSSRRLDVNFCQPVSRHKSVGAPRNYQFQRRYVSLSARRRDETEECGA